MYRTTLIVMLVLIIAGLVVVYIWSSYNRFYILIGGDGIAYEVDRRTGETWKLADNQKILQQVPIPEPEILEEPLSLSDQLLITGNANFDSGKFAGSIYNGSPSTISRLTIHITAKEPTDAIRWSRDYAVPMTILPLTSEPFSINVTGSDYIYNYDWSIIEVMGYKDPNAQETNFLNSTPTVGLPPEWPSSVPIMTGLTDVEGSFSGQYRKEVTLTGNLSIDAVMAFYSSLEGWWKDPASIYPDITEGPVRRLSFVRSGENLFVHITEEENATKLVLIYYIEP